MLCCVGLFGGLAVGQALGGPWTVAAPAVGFAAGLAGDMKLMKRMHKDSAPQPNHAAERKQEVEPSTAAAPAGHGSCCGVASATGSRRAWLIGGVGLAALAIFAGWDWIEANGLTPYVVILAFLPLLFVCMRGHGAQRKEKTEMSLADIRKTYQTDSAEPPRSG